MSGPAAPQPATVTRRDIVGQVVLSGQIVVPPSAQASLNPPFRATVNKVDRSVGAEVRKGDTLVELAMPSAATYHEQTKQALKDAEAAYTNAKQQRQATVDAAQKRLDATRATGSTAAAATDNTASGNPPTDADQSATDRAAAEQELLQAKADMAEQMLPYQQQLEQAREANRQAFATEEQGSIRTPISGTVMALNAQPGKEVAPDVRTPVATVVDLNALQAQSSMTPRQAGYVKPGMDVTLNFDEIPEKTFEGTVYRMTSLPGNRGYVAIIKFRNTGEKVKPGMKPHVAIKTGKSVKSVLSVPSATLRVDSDGKPTVNVMRDGKWQAVVVEPGLSDMQFTEIRSGLKQDDTVQVLP
jgi:multidrug efflux pump subunit AcrA (membrane-fusion protein)